MANILIVEDEKAISDLIAMNISMAGYTYEQIYNGNEVEDEVRKNIYNLIILDVMIPGQDGFRVLEKIKKYNVPVIFLTAKDSLCDKLTGLKGGAEDYITKPFESLELLARIDVVLRRYNTENNIINLNELTIDTDKHLVKINDDVIELTIKEYELLLLLHRNVNKAISREKILESVWGYEFFGETRTVDIHIQRLRKKLKNNINIATVYKYGYRLEV